MPVAGVDRRVKVPVMRVPTDWQGQSRAGYCLVIMGVSVLKHYPAFRMMDVTAVRGWHGRPANIETLVGMSLAAGRMGGTAMVVVGMTLGIRGHNLLLLCRFS